MNRERQLVVAAVLLLVTLTAASLWVLRMTTRSLRGGEGVAGEGPPDGSAPWFDPASRASSRTITRADRGRDLSGDRAEDARLQQQEEDVIPNQHIVRLRSPGAWQALAARVAAAGGRLRTGLQELGLALVELPEGADLARVLEGLDAQSAGANHRVHVPERDSGPIQVDAQRAFADQYLSWLGVRGDNSTWGAGVKVAVIDTGVGASSAFGAGQVQTIDLLGGAGGQGGDHGAAIAAIIAGQLGSGIAPGAQILDIRILDSDGVGDAYTLAEAILTATKQGANILNLSLGSYGDSEAVKQALDYAWQRGVLVVASAGNDGAAMLTYPARYSGVVSVGAIDGNGAPLSFSNSESGLDYAGPGLGMQVAMGDGTAITISGTSPSAAVLSGVLAAVRSWEPNLSATDLLSLLSNYANDLDAPGVDELTGHGTIDLQRIAERSQRGIYDMAVSGLHLDIANASEGGVPLVIAVQNRGTEFIASAQVKATVGVGTYTFTISSIKPGESRGQTVAVSLAALKQSQSVGVDAAVSTTGTAVDRKPWNNRLRSTISLRPGN